MAKSWHSLPTEITEEVVTPICLLLNGKTKKIVDC